MITTFIEFFMALIICICQVFSVIAEVELFTVKYYTDKCKLITSMLNVGKMNDALF